MTEAIRKGRAAQPIAAGLKPFYQELEKRYEQADSRTIGYIPSHKGRGRKAGRKPETGHPWRSVDPGEKHGEGSHFKIGESGEPQPVHTRHNFERPKYPGSSCTGAAMDYCIKHDPDGWNARFDGSGPVRHLVKDGRPLTDRGAELLKSSPGESEQGNQARGLTPPHSKQTKQVHNYQRTLGRK